MHRALPAFIAGLLTILPGCADPDTSTAQPTTESAAAGDGADPFAKPATWVKGQWWTYAVTLDGEPGDPATLVVTANETDNYVVDINTRVGAGFDAEFDVSYIGPISKEGLSGRQQGLKVEYFRWPLRAGDEWTTVWDGVSRKIRAVGPTNGQFELEGVENGTVAVQYSYDPVSGFFGHLDFVDPDGKVRFGSRLTSSGIEFRGEYVRAEFETYYAIDSNDQPAGSEVEDFTILDGTDSLVIRYSVGCAVPAGGWDFTLAPFDTGGNQSQQFGDRGTCPGQKEGDHTIENPIAGSWGYRGQYALVTGPNHHTVAIVGFKFTSFPVA